MSRRSLLVLLAAFTVSVGVRWPLIDRPLSAHHEYCTAFTLIALTNWWEDGIAAHHGVPSGGWVRPAKDLYPPDRFSRNERAIGLYYFSHPPLAYDVPYALFRTLGVAPNASGLQWMNILFHLVTTLALFRVVQIAAGVGAERTALLAAVLYLFLPVTLWFHGNAYMSDMFVQVPWVLHLVFAMHVLKRDAVPSRWIWVGHGITLFLVLYTSWLGVFAALTGVAAAALRWRRGRTEPWCPVVGLSVLAGAAAFGLTAWRFLQVIDARALLDHYMERFAVRGSIGAGQDLVPLLKQVLVNYRISFLPLALLLLLLFVRRLVRKEPAVVPSGDFQLFLLLTGLPVVLDHALLLQYAAHDFAALKAAPMLCGLAAWSLVRLGVRWSRVALALTCVACVLYFYRTNPIPGGDAGRYEQERDLGLFIAANAKPDEVVFGLGISTEPQVTWYARRNVIGVPDVDAARELLTDRGLAHGVVIASENGRLTATPIAP